MSNTLTDVPAEPLGAMLTRGPNDWQIIQRDPDGWGQLDLAGRWAAPEPGVVEVGVLHQDTGVPGAGLAAGRDAPRRDVGAEHAAGAGRGDMRHGLGGGGGRSVGHCRAEQLGRARARAGVRSARAGGASAAQQRAVGAGHPSAVDPNANCFEVEDGAGLAPIIQVSYPGGPVVRLELGRALSGPAVVHGGGGLAPASAPMDMERLLPMLGFYGVAVTTG